MRAEIVCIGDELLTGQHVDTNSVYLGNKLEELGIQVAWKTTIGDDLRIIKDGIGVAVGRADLVIATGGLGPTSDDVTVRGVAEFLSRELVFHPQIQTEIEAKFRRRGLTTPECNRKQALLPRGATLLPNAHGMSPGLFFEESGKFLFFLPGVPAEMRPMFEESVLPRLRERSRGQVILRRRLRTTGLPESEIDDRLGSFTEGQVKIAFLPQYSGVDLTLTVFAEDQTRARASLSETEGRIRERLSEAIYGAEDETLEMVVGRLLAERGETLAVAESCTGGLIGHRLTNVPGSSGYFQGGVVAYSNRAKMEILGVSRQAIEQHGAVSSQTAEAMALGIRDISITDYGLSVTGIAGPTGGTREKPVGLVYIGLAHAHGALSEKFIFGQDRRENKERAAQAALNMLRIFLLKM